MHPLLATTLVLAALAPAAHANLLVDGSFEDTAVTPGGFTVYAGGQSFGGWTVGGVDVLLVDTDYVEGGPQAFPAFDGRNAVDLTGAGNTGPTDTVFQTVATMPGQRYRLTFALGNAAGTSNRFYTLASQIAVQIDGTDAAVFSNAAITTDSVNWALQRFEFTATGESTTIGFRNATAFDMLGIGADDSYAGLDDVVLEAVAAPAPAAIALFGLGLGMLGLRRR